MKHIGLVLGTVAFIIILIFAIVYGNRIRYSMYEKYVRETVEKVLQEKGLIE